MWWWRAPASEKGSAVRLLDGAANHDVGDALSRLSPGRELLFDPAEPLEIGITPFVVSLLQLFERRVSSVRVHGHTADPVPLARVIALEVRHHGRLRLFARPAPHGLRRSSPA